MGEQPQSNAQNPTAIWQGMWAYKIAEILEDLRNFETMKAWNDLEDLKIILPPECEIELEENYKETKKVVFKENMVSFIPTIAQKQITHYRSNIIVPVERLLVSDIKKSLFNKGWINKDFAIHPRQGTATIRCPE